MIFDGSSDVAKCALQGALVEKTKMGKFQPQISHKTRGLRMPFLVLGIGGAIKKSKHF